MPHYVTKLGEKNYWHESLCERVFVPKTMTVIFFGAVAKEWQLKFKMLYIKNLNVFFGYFITIFV
jgi:hypothetical protein